jgi:hypothetical protein
MDKHPGMTTPSETYGARDGGPDWPPDRFTRMVMDTAPAAGAVGIDTPAAHSYANDANMEAFDALPPYVMSAPVMTDPARYTGAISDQPSAIS